MRLNRFIPRFLLDKLNSKIDEIIINNKRIGFIEERLNKMVYDVYQNYPPYIIQTETVKYQIKKFIELYNIPERLNTIVSKNDIMYQYALKNIDGIAPEYEFDFSVLDLEGKYAAAYHHYLVRGLNSMNVIRRLVENNFGNIENVNSFLDFGSGYGKFIRFLILEFDYKKIWVCDRKSLGIDFQIEQFGVNGFTSPTIPEDFPMDRKFDIIYASSVFSHLPKKLFFRWLQTLNKLVNENGLLIFTVHDLSLINKDYNGDSYYINENEDASFTYIKDIIPSSEAYGSMYVSENFVKKQLEKIGVKKSNYFRYPRGLGGVQDIYILTKNNNYDDQVDLSNYP